MREADSPIGVLQLVVHREDGVTWVGVARRDAGYLGGVGLRTGSIETEIVGGVDMYGEGVGCVAGAVSRRIERAEVITRDGAREPVEIVDIPPDLEDEYRAIWAVLREPGERSRLVGYDARGRMYDVMDPKNDGDPPTDDERFRGMRRHAQETLRYYATAIEFEPEQRKVVEGAMQAAAYFLALTDADALDPRTVMARRSKLVEEYAEDARTNPWKPPPSSDP